MSDVTKGIPEKQTVTIGDTEYELKRLTIYDRANLLRASRKAGREQLKQDQKELGVAADLAVATLHEYDTQTLDEPMWVRYCSDCSNDYDIIVASLSHTVPADQAKELAKSVEPDFNAKITLCGLRIATEPAEGTDPNPPAGEQVPMVYGA